MPRELTERITCEKCGHTIETEVGGQVTGQHGEPCAPSTPGAVGQGREHERPAEAEKPPMPAPSHQTTEPSRRR